jgi:endonuclease/exonuclease/phosphatase family metal-dependent hydrolase
MSNEQKIMQDEKKQRKQKRYFFNRIAMFGNHIVAISLLFSYAAPYISPQTFWPLAFFGLAYPLILLVNIAFVIYWAFQLKKRALYSLLLIVCGFKPLMQTIELNLFNNTPGDKSVVKVMSFNTKVFDLYNWSHNMDTRKKIFEMIDDEHPDIICFQEFYSRDSSKYNNYEALFKIANLKNAHVEYTSHGRFKQHFGIATYTKYPIINRGKIDFGYKGNNVCIYTDLLIGKDTVRVYNMHLQSIAFSKDDYKYAEDLQNEQATTEDVEHSKNILRRLKRAFVKRSKQADLIGAHIQSSPYKVFVCGDFNDTPTSYTYSTISKQLDDSFVKSGRGLGKTYSGVFPSFRIDYILHSKSFQSYNFKIIKEEYSDHYPVVTYIAKK